MAKDNLIFEAEKEYDEKPRKKKKRTRTPLIVVIVLLSLFVCGFLGYNFLVVAAIDVSGNTVYSDDDIAALAAIPINTHVWLIDEKTIKNNIEKDPHLTVENIEYIFPDTVAITVTERAASAYCSDGSAYVAVSADMTVLETGIADIEGGYPEIVGMEISSKELARKIAAEDQYKVTVAEELLTAAIAMDMLGDIKSVDFTDINSIAIALRSGLDVNFGQPDNFEEKIQWIGEMQQTLISEGEISGTIDVSGSSFATFRPTHSSSLPEADGNTAFITDNGELTVNNESEDNPAE